MKRILQTSYLVVVMMAMGLTILILSSTNPTDAHEHAAQTEDRPERETPSSIPLNPTAGSEIGYVYEAFLSPHQEGGEEEDTPVFIPPAFRSTTPSVPRNERTSRGHGVIEFTKDLSKAYVYLAIEGVNVADINMFHLHCGKPGQLGPIIVDFSTAGNVQSYFSDGVLSVEVTNEDITAVTAHIANPVDAFTSGCPIDPSNPVEKIRTIAGMEVVARQGEIYFNLHTTGQTYFGEMRGQVYLVEER